MAEFRIIEQAAPGTITFNYDELKNEIEQKAKMYETLVYTDATMNEAKQDKAKLNKLKKALNDERIKREKEFMEPFQTFKKQVNEIISIIDTPIQIIDSQVKAYEDSEKEKKSNQIRKIWDKKETPEWLELARVWNEKWLNKTTSLKAIEEEIDEKLDNIKKEITTIGSMKFASFEAMEEYKRTLNLAMALQEGQRLADIQKRKAEAEAKAKAEAEAKAKAEEIQKNEPEQIAMDASQHEEKSEESKGEWLRFAARLTYSQAIELRNFLTSKNIEFKPIQ